MSTYTYLFRYFQTSEFNRGKWLRGVRRAERKTKTGLMLSLVTAGEAVTPEAER